MGPKQESFLVKYLLFLFNLLFWVCGMVILISGATVQIRYSSYISFLGQSSLSAPSALIAVGIAITVVGFFGCCGSVRENYCMAITYSVLLMAMFLIEIAAGLASYLLRQDVNIIMRSNALNGMSFYNQTGEDLVTAAWDRVQVDYACCGVDGPQDWNVTRAFRNNFDLPDSCCTTRKTRRNCGFLMRSPNTASTVFNNFIHTTGCMDKLSRWAGANAGVLSGIGFGVGFFQIIGIILACSFSYNLRQRTDFF